MSKYDQLTDLGFSIATNQLPPLPGKPRGWRRWYVTLAWQDAVLFDGLWLNGVDCACPSLDDALKALFACVDMPAHWLGRQSFGRRLAFKDIPADIAAKALEVIG